MPVQAHTRCFTSTWRRRLGIAEAKRRIEIDDLLVPAHLALVDQLGQQQGRHCLGVGGGDEERVGVDRIGLAQRPHAKAAFEDDLAAVDQGQPDPRDFELPHGVLQEILEQRDPFGVQRMGLAACEPLARITLGPQASDRERKGRTASLEGRLRRLDDDDRPVARRAPCQRIDDGLLVGRRFIGIDVALFPAVVGRLVGPDLERPFGVGTIARPTPPPSRRRHRPPAHRPAPLRVGLRRLEDGLVRRRSDPPTDRCREGGAVRRDERGVDRQRVGGEGWCREKAQADAERQAKDTERAHVATYTSGQTKGNGAQGRS